MSTARQAARPRAIVTAALALAAGLLAATTGASAQVSRPRDAPPPGTGDLPGAASPDGARYFPGIGFRFVPPPGYVYGYRPRVYGYYADRESMRYTRGYRASRVACDRDWFGDRCRRGWR
jgi:hypothetical protein